MKHCIFLALFVPVLLLVGLSVAEETCSPICTMEYNPVCAGDGVSKPVIFGNPCGFQYYNCANPDKLSSSTAALWHRKISFPGASRNSCRAQEYDIGALCIQNSGGLSLLNVI